MQSRTIAVLLLSLGACATAGARVDSGECFQSASDVMFGTPGLKSLPHRLVLERRPVPQFARFGWQRASLTHTNPAIGRVWGRWRAIGSDSVQVYIGDMFTSLELRLERSAVGLEGLRRLTTDQYRQDADGVHRPIFSEGSVALTAGCPSPAGEPVAAPDNAP